MVFISAIRASNLRKTIGCFEMVSKLNINWDKSCVAGIKISEAELTSFSEVLCCICKQWPLNYLGLPLGG